MPGWQRANRCRHGHLTIINTTRPYANCGFITLCRFFFARRAKKNLQKKKSTMLPQAKAAFLAV
jgi:hypothetical protein